MVTKVALLGAGCFWGVEHLFRKVEGVLATDVGYAGGHTPNPTYPEVCSGSTDHAEVVRVEFDPAVISYEALLDIFFRLHDPTTPNRQHNDIGTQYRSVIFTQDETQQKKAQEMIKNLEEKKVFPAPIVTQVLPASEFFLAEPYHQDYLIKNPTGYMCHVLRPQK